MKIKVNLVETPQHAGLCMVCKALLTEETCLEVAVSMHGSTNILVQHINYKCASDLALALNLAFIGLEDDNPPPKESD